MRSPMGKGKRARDGRPGGALSELQPVELPGQTISALFERNDVDPAEVDDVIVGCVRVSQVVEQAGPVGRWAWLGAGLPEAFGRSLHRTAQATRGTRDARSRTPGAPGVA